MWPWQVITLCTAANRSANSVFFSLNCFFSFFPTFSCCSSTHRVSSAVCSLKTVLCKTIQWAVLVWACCTRCWWDNDIWSSKSGWSSRLLHLKVNQRNTVQQFIILSGVTGYNHQLDAFIYTTYLAYICIDCFTTNNQMTLYNVTTCTDKTYQPRSQEEAFMGRLICIVLATQGPRCHGKAK